MSLSDALPPQEKYLIAANHYRIAGDTEKAIEAYENLVKASPNSAMVQFDLGGLYEQSGELEQAQQQFAKVVELDPKFVEGLLALGRVEIKRGDPQASLEPLNSALTLAIQLNHDEARANMLQAIGIAYKQLGRPTRRSRTTRSRSRSSAARQQARHGRQPGEIAQIQERHGTPEAEQSYKEALKLQREIGDKSGMSMTLINLAALLNDTLGRPDDALPLLREALQLRRDAGNPPARRWCSTTSATSISPRAISRKRRPTSSARSRSAKRPKSRPDLADTLHNLGETLSKRALRPGARAISARARLRRSAGDKRGAAIESYSIGTSSITRGATAPR